MKTKLMIVLLAGIGFTSCNKYEEGPAISIIPKNERVANTWVVERAENNGNDVTSDYDQFDLYLTDDGDAQLDANFTLFGTQYQTSTNGTWTFTNDDANIKLDFEDDDYDEEYQILKLTTDEMWLRELGGETELHFTEK